MSKIVEANSSLLFEYGGKTYNFTYKEKDGLDSTKSSKNDNNVETNEADSKTSSLTNDDSGHSTGQYTSSSSKDKILPKTGQSSNIVSIVVGSIMTVTGVSITFIKKFVKM